MCALQVIAILLLVLGPICAIIFGDLLIFCVFGLVAVILILIVKKREEKEAAEEEKKAAEEEKKEIEERKEEIRKRKMEFDRLYGTCVKEIKSDSPTYYLQSIVYVYKDSEIIVLDNIAYKFSDIISYSATGKDVSIGGKVISTTKIDSKSMIGRAVAGGLVAGSAGMVLGGATAKSDTTTTYFDGFMSHFYNIYISINDLSNPVAKIFFADDGECANELISILNIIIKNNKK